MKEIAVIILEFLGKEAAKEAMKRIIRELVKRAFESQDEKEKKGR